MRDFEKDFEEWLLNVFLAKNQKVRPSHKLRAISFKNIPFSMQWGVHVDFFDEHSIRIFEVLNRTSGKIGFEIWTKENKGSWKKETPFLLSEYTRNEARKAALEKAKEIYNNKI